MELKPLIKRKQPGVYLEIEEMTKEEIETLEWALKFMKDYERKHKR